MSLYSEITKNKNKVVFFANKKVHINELILKINERAKKLKKYKLCTAILETRNKENFLINLYACNKIGLKVCPIENIKKIQALKFNFKFNLLLNKKINVLSKKKQTLNKSTKIILKTSGTTGKEKFVLLSNKNISYITTEMNKAMKLKKNINEIIFAPIDHAFGFGRLHALMKSEASLTFLNNLNFSDLFYFYKMNNCNSLSIPAKILEKILKHNKGIFFKQVKNCKYFQVSTGYLSLKNRKIITSKKINLFINYGMTEAMRTTFLDALKYRNKIHTEGKPFKEIKIKIMKNNSSKDNFGELMIKGPHVCLGYSDTGLNKSRFKNKWFMSGDIVKIDQGQFLTYLSRVNNNINYNGINYDIDEIESFIKQKFKIENLKIINTNNKLKIFCENDLTVSKLYSSLKKNKINITFDKIYKNVKFNFHANGKIRTEQLY